MPLSDDQMAALVAQNQPKQAALSDDDMLKLVQSQPQSQAQPSMTQGHASRLGAEEGFTFGLTPFAAGVGAGAGSAVGTFNTQRSSGRGLLESAKSAYEAGKTGFVEGRQERNQELERAASEYPKTYYGSMLASGLLTAPLTPVKSLGQAAKLGAGLGATNALSTADNLKDAAKDVALGTATGGLLHAGGSAVVRGAEALGGAGEAVSSGANKLAAKAFGPYQADVLKNKDRLASIGKTALKENVLGVIPKSYEKLAERAQGALENKGQEFESMLNQISDAADKVAQGSSGNLPAAAGQVAPKAGVSTSAIADQLKKELASNPRLPGGKNFNKSVDQYVQEFVGNNPNLISIKDAQGLKQELGERINWRRDPRADIPQAEQMDRALYHALNKGVEDAADAAAPQLGPEALAKWKQVKQEYGDLKTAAAWADRRAGREFANRFISPTDYISILGGAAMHGTGAGLILGAANHGARKFGNQALATTINSAGKLVSGVGNKAGVIMPYLETGAQKGLLVGGSRQ